MQATLVDGVVRVGGNARERFYDSQGYGRPRGDELDLAPVEAAHLLYREDLAAVDGMGLESFLAETGVALSFVVYRDLRERGFYLSPAREEWVETPAGADLVVYPRGKGPWDGETAYRMRVLGEREPVRARSLGDAALAVVDEDGELTYFETATPDPRGETAFDPPRATGTLLSDRVLVWDPPAALHEAGFYGQRLHGRNAESGPLQLSLVEAAHLADRGALSLRDADRGALCERGRAVEGERFDRRLAAYVTLRERGLVPKSGFKFGSDFRAYAGFQSVEEMGHSDYLVRVVAPDHVFAPRDVSLDVRLAAGVRKRTLFALTAADGTVEWRSVGRLTP
ncbi:MAG: tRNA-intron lyase [Haloarculaceae archaeon]